MSKSIDRKQINKINEAPSARRPIPCIVAGNGYWGKIVQKYIANAGFAVESIYTRASGMTFDELCEKSAANAVFICTPVSTHYELVRTALLHGKHVFCEKMLTGNPEQAAELYAFAESKGLVLITDYIYLNSPSVKYMKEHISELGRPLSIRACISQLGKFYDDADVMENIGVHMLSVCGLLTDWNSDVLLKKYRLGYVSPASESAGNLAPDEENPSSSGAVLLKKYNIGGDFSANTQHNDGTDINPGYPLPCTADIEMSADCDELSVQASIVSPEKVRRIEVAGPDGTMTFDMMAEEKLKLSLCGKQPEAFAWDEGNNLQSALEEFRAAIAGASWDANRACCEYVETIMAMLRSLA